MVHVHVAVVLGVCASFISGETNDRYCLPTSACWPSKARIQDLDASLGGNAVTLPDDARYKNVTMPMNMWYYRKPGIVLAVKTTEDVQKTMRFATEFNIQVVIKGSGHDFIGRNTGDNSLMINTALMTDIKLINASHSRYTGPAVVVGTGNDWARVYKEVHGYGYVIVGGSAQTVGMGGYTSGGGHSPMSRILGLAVDSVLEFTIVLPNGSIAEATEDRVTLSHGDGNTFTTNDAGLFWAVRGGGGSTFGVVTRFTFRVHTPAKVYTRLACGGPWLTNTNILIGDGVLDVFFSTIKQLPREWGGYWLINGYNLRYLKIGDTIGGLFFALLYAGHSYEHASSTIKPLQDYLRRLPIQCELQNYTSFWDYEKTVNDVTYGNSYITNILLPNNSFDGQALRKLLSRHLMPGGNKTTGTGIACTGALLGGKVGEFPDDSAAISDDFRRSLTSLSCGVGWDKTTEHWKDPFIQSLKSLQKDIRSSFGKAVYFNEPPFDLDDWKTAYWGDKYNRLLLIKSLYDPRNRFACRHCVGDDESVTGYVTIVSDDESVSGHVTIDIFLLAHSVILAILRM